jgi:hypothetical protein
VPVVDEEPSEEETTEEETTEELTVLGVEVDVDAFDS